MAIEKKYGYLPDGAAKYEGVVHKHALFILQKQLKDVPLWGKFVRVLRQKADGAKRTHFRLV